MLKFQRNRAKPQLIRIFLVTLIHRFTQQRKRRSPIATKTHTNITSSDISVKKIHNNCPRINLNGNIFFELLLGYLDENMTSAG